MARYGGLGQIENRHEIAHAELAPGKERQDAKAGFVGQGLEESGYIFHD
jgi:hypothetical protein